MPCECDRREEHLARVLAMQRFFGAAKHVEAHYFSLDAQLLTLTGDAIPLATTTCACMLEKLHELERSSFTGEEPQLVALEELRNTLFEQQLKLPGIGIGTQLDREKIDAKLQQLRDKFAPLFPLPSSSILIPFSFHPFCTPSMGVARIFSGGGETSKILKKFRMKIAKNALF